MPQDALNSFHSLLEQVPGWITGLQNILDNATRQQNELLFVNEPADSDETLVRKASKSSSLKSKRSRGGKSVEPSAVNDTTRLHTPERPIPTLLRPQLAHMTESDALRLSQRKRKTFSACSGDMSGPCKYRSRALVVVYYDGDIQQRLTDIVQGLSACRNDIRRSKMSAKVDMLSRSGSSSSGSGNDGSAGEKTAPKSIGSFTYKTTRLRLQELSPMGKPDGCESLDKVDGLLERSQNLCEHAAHQVLRDGDCVSEVSKVKNLLEEAKSSAELELPNLEKLAAQAEERRARTEERQRLDRSRQPPPPPADSEKIELLSRPPSNDPLEVDEIEVDDEDDDSDTEFEMAALRLKLPPNSTKYSMQSARLTAY